MQKGKVYILFFVIIVSAITALILSAASNYLKDKQVTNAEIDMKKNILAAVGLTGNKDCNNINNNNSNLKANSCCNILECYDKNIKSFIIDYNGKIIKSDLSSEKIFLRKELKKNPTERSFPVFTRIKNNKVITYCIPLVGKGLWGRIYGYIALEVDLNTVKGVSFYKHSETPGLGARIEESWFLNNFKGKKILNSKGNLVSVNVIKGEVNEKSASYIHEVDGITGATITSKAVSVCIKDCLSLYEPYFKLIRKGVE